MTVRDVLSSADYLKIKSFIPCIPVNFLNSDPVPGKVMVDADAF